MPASESSTPRVSSTPSAPKDSVTPSASGSESKFYVCDATVPCDHKRIGEVSMGAAKEIGGRPCQEDMVHMDENTQSATLCDGHGGDYFSKRLVSEFWDRVVAHPDYPENVKKAIEDTCVKLDEECLQTSSDEYKQVGTTLTAAQIFNDKLWLAWVGDSQIVVAQNGEMVFLSKPHNTKNSEELQRVKEAGGTIIARKFASKIGHPVLKDACTICVTRAFGNRVFKDSEYTNGLPSGLIPTPEIHEFDANMFDFVILASDGFWDKIPPEGAVDRVYKKLATGMNVQDVADELVAAASDSSDNVSVIIIAN